jgi:monovalent cation:H+ antiporter-2, CPA2 family
MNTGVAFIVHVNSAASSEAFSTLFLEFGSMLLVLGLLAMLARKLDISAIPFYLIAGLILGQGGFDVIDQSNSLVPTLAELGVILLLLLLGLEYSGRELVDTARAQSKSGAIDLIANFTPGALFGFLLGWGLPGAFALGGVTYISSSGIVSQVVRDLRWRRNPETKPVVSVLVLEDLVMAPYLPILTVILTGTGLVTGLISVGVALIVVAIVIVISIKRSNAIQRLFNASEPVGLLLVVFGAAVAVGGLAGLFEFSPPVAAFLVGLLLTGEIAEVARRRLDPLRELFAAIFFVYFGLNTDVSEIPSMLLPAAILAIITIATKFLTGWFAAKTVSKSTISRLRAGALRSSRGEFSVIIAGLAATSTLLPSSFQALVAGYILLTATAGPILARFAEGVGWWWDQRPGVVPS